jgi:hypothetical protein
METADSARKAIAPPDISMTGPVVPAGCMRTTEPACEMEVLIRCANSASASRGAASRGPQPIRPDSRSRRNADLRSSAVRPGSR